MSPQIDPEVAADIRLRNATATDSTRGGAAIYSWRPPRIAECWDCRASGCASSVGITEEALDACATWDRILANRGESPLDRSAIVFCDACRTVGRELAANRNRTHASLVADVIRQLKEGKPKISIPTRKGERIATVRETFAWLEANGHPDVSALELSLNERRESGRSRPRKGDV